MADKQESREEEIGLSIRAPLAQPSEEADRPRTRFGHRQDLGRGHGGRGQRSGK